VLSIPLSSLVEKVQSNEIQPGYVLIAYGKAAIKAHRDTNCLTEIMIDEAFSKWAYGVDKTGPLAGVPISLKDVSTILRPKT
jgi:Asp-tRNA(Asn)/Glu-tRNA(Gln) amidotransferase A subunit family amidase